MDKSSRNCRKKSPTWNGNRVLALGPSKYRFYISGCITGCIDGKIELLWLQLPVVYYFKRRIYIHAPIE